MWDNIGHRHTLRTCDTAIILVVLKRLNVTFIRTLPVLLLLGKRSLFVVRIAGNTNVLWGHKTRFLVLKVAIMC